MSRLFSTITIILFGFLAGSPAGAQTNWWYQIVPPAGGCNGHDVDNFNGKGRLVTEGTWQPNDTICGQLRGGIAVCWDGDTYKNASNSKNDPKLPWCTYKNIDAEQCTSLKETPGIRFRCPVR